ncbi:hypothetical protein [Kaistella jeonii]|uniref:Uncharacterized protein n=1 Tax=Kaistella jeonii TaxID=266749 RepID=A0A0C1CV67_9FLAO|nr:hypothetical protein [Kaistella jeonii]KIA88221.1 hypothetical protein OA86_11915 [Kaistella jeonii]SFC26179.1 hypothetical protein SAMN05421876_11139 [Kaistella jeonii]VEI95685.1 Uncharacterised protein [Kaistella jeonii]
MKKSLYILSLLLMVSCSKESKIISEILPQDSTKLIPVDSLKNANLKTESGKLSKEETLKKLNNEILSTLKSKDYDSFSNYIHPEKGITFSMYSYINPKKDKHFSGEGFKNYSATKTRFTWGEKDGTGDLLVLSIKDYMTEWVFTRNFKNSEFYFNEFKGIGNTINNIKKIYPNDLFTENFIPGTEIFSGMDWSSLIFVFEQYNDNYYLVAVANNSWTT